MPETMNRQMRITKTKSVPSQLFRKENHKFPTRARL